jgi:hypothetical protein
MSTPVTEQTFNRFVEDFPFPIAFALKESVIEAPDAEHQVRGIIQTFTTGIQFVALICASEYARAEYRDIHLSWSFETLKRPLISHFFNFTSAAAKSFQKNSVTPLVAELGAFVEKMEQTHVVVPVMVDNVPRDQSLRLRKALEELRNTLAHKRYWANWPELAAQYLHLEGSFPLPSELSPAHGTTTHPGD